MEQIQFPQFIILAIRWQRKSISIEINLKDLKTPAKLRCLLGCTNPSAGTTRASFLSQIKIEITNVELESIAVGLKLKLKL